MSSTGFFSDLVSALGLTAIFAILLRQVLSFRNYSSSTTLFRALESLTEPWFSVIRRQIPQWRGIDLSPWVALAVAAGLTLFLRLLLSRGTA
ncbi:MAG TPA: YggT family protein [Fibrobacteria bacterium]|nr:YggT family protein [Fibrobacteria bacterium]HOX52576.1 YggT family protein [Fibrobacteria bacterium]